ncbi:hypothetical protein BDM02DRAFT_2390237 [Thelephora ganbajun]|uniref:Uncharacterized protein n=1 Tax=Thelephora ganbajun TaxID=370292 RepID=A0ACB6ZTM9_THEGA|nr:hypothetical protein BDM02DRAFT_2390237 [Thelephora ganbajun]
MTGLLLALKGVISEDDLDVETTEKGVPQTTEIPSHSAEYRNPEGGSNTHPENVTVQIPHTQISPEVTYGISMPTEALDSPMALTSLDHPAEITTSVVDTSLDNIHPRSPNTAARTSHTFSPQTPDKPSRDDSIDSGYAEVRASTPPPLTISTPLSQWKHSTLNLLSSPFGSPTTRAFPPAQGRLSALISPRFGSSPSSMSERAPSPTERIAETVDATRRHSDDAKSRRPISLTSFPNLEKDLSPAQDDPCSFPSPSPSSLDSPGAYPALQPNITTAQGDDEETTSPAMSEVALSRKRASSTLTVMPPSVATESPPPLPESLPWAADAEDDTVTSMYGLYHSSSSDHVWSPPSPVQNYSRPSSSASFYPPRPSSAAAELHSPKSPLNDNHSTGSPFVPSRSSSALSIHVDLGSPSSTVPIGFRDQKRHGSRRAPATFHRPQPLILSPPHSGVELEQPLSSGPRSLKPLRLSMILNSSQSLASSQQSPTLVRPVVNHTQTRP